MRYESVFLVGWHHIWSGAVDGVVYSLTEGFRRAGYYAQSIIFKANEVPANFNELLRPTPCKLIIGITHTSLFVSIDGKRLWDLVKADFATYFIDNPAFFAEDGLKHLLEAPEEMSFLFADNAHKRQFQSYLLTKGRKNDCIFFPYGGNLYPRNEENAKDTINEVKITVFANVGAETPQFFHGIRKGVKSLPLIKDSNLPNSAKDYIINQLPLCDYDYDLFDYFSSLTESRHLYLDQDTMLLYLAADSYLKRCRRIFTVRELKNFNVQIYGSGWSEVAGEIPPNWNLSESVSYSKQFDIFLDSDIILNVDPVWSEGIHDRVFNAMSCGAIPLTNYNKLTPFFLEHGINSLVYNSASEIPQLISSNLPDLVKIKKTIRNTFHSLHTWRQRIDSVIDRIYLRNDSRFSPL